MVGAAWAGSCVSAGCAADGESRGTYLLFAAAVFLDLEKPDALCGRAGADAGDDAIHGMAHRAANGIQHARSDVDGTSNTARACDRICGAARISPRGAGCAARAPSHRSAARATARLVLDLVHPGAGVQRKRGSDAGLDVRGALDFGKRSRSRVADGFQHSAGRNCAGLGRALRILAGAKVERWPCGLRRALYAHRRNQRNILTAGACFWCSVAWADQRQSCVGIAPAVCAAAIAEDALAHRGSTAFCAASTVIAILGVESAISLRSSIVAARLDRGGGGLLAAFLARRDGWLDRAGMCGVSAVVWPSASDNWNNRWRGRRAVGAQMEGRDARNDPTECECDGRATLSLPPRKAPRVALAPFDFERTENTQPCGIRATIGNRRCSAGHWRSCDIQPHCRILPS